VCYNIHAMRCAILILLSVASTRIVPGQGQSSPAKRDESHAESAKKPEPKPPTSNTVVVVQQETANAQNNGPKSTSQGYFTRLIAPENLPNIVLCFVGIGGIIIAIHTLRAIENQVTVQMESLRPRVIAEAADDPSKTFADVNARRVSLRVTNKGIVPATGYKYESWIEVLPDHTGDFTGVADHHVEETISVLYPGFPHIANIPLRIEVTEEESRQISHLKRYVCVRIYIEYDDPFNPKRRCYSNFGFYLLPGGFGFLDKHNNVGYKKA